MSKIGYYRYKTLVSDGRGIAFFKNGLQDGLATIKQLDRCEDDRIVKFLDSKGQYRLFVFNRFYEVTDNPRQIGTANKFITSILTDKTNKNNIGYRNERRLSLTADVTNEQLSYLSDIYTSARVYLYIGSLISDIDSDWLEVELSGDNVAKRRKAKSGSVDVTITLPEWFTIKMV